ncbi:uncharacterized protein DS421_20g698550 [Arachis hypogaea]|nr:uncharacterized protein DS421_20g698550 [Arachis hypogaea]
MHYSATIMGMDETTIAMSNVKCNVLISYCTQFLWRLFEVWHIHFLQFDCHKSNVFRLFMYSVANENTKSIEPSLEEYLIVW